MNTSQKRDAVMLALGLVIFAVLYGLMETGVIGSFWKLNILIIGINIIMAASLNLINGYTGQFSLGHAGFMAVGAYVSVVLTTNFHLPSVFRRSGCPATISRSRRWVFPRSSASC